MSRHLEESTQRAVEAISAKVVEMGRQGEMALREVYRSLEEMNRTLAYTIILRDQRIDELEKEVDRLCLEFLVRHQPVGGLLRRAYATLRINLELERVGDYAEGIARQVLKLASTGVESPAARFREIAERSTGMLRDAVRAYAEQDATLAKRTMEQEPLVDVLKSRINSELIKQAQAERGSIEALNSLLMIARHFERVSDQARNICVEVLYMVTGEYARHSELGRTRILFLGKRNACRSQIAEALLKLLGGETLVGASAGVQAGEVDADTIEFLKRKGIDWSQARSKGVDGVPHADQSHILVALCPEARELFPKPPTRTICLDWMVEDPSESGKEGGSKWESYEQVYAILRGHMLDLVGALKIEDRE